MRGCRRWLQTRPRTQHFTVRCVMDARSFAVALNGQVVGPNRILAPGPGHSPCDRSLSILVDSAAPEGFLVNSFSADDWRECRDHVRRAMGLAKPASVARRTTGQRPRTTTTADALALLITGDGSHQLTVQEISQFGRLGLRAIAATDYPGLGTPGPHPYLVGDSEARAVIDSVRAARSFPGLENSTRYAVW